MLPNIFEAFYATREAGKGTGIGLSMVHGIMHNYGGHILTDSTHGEGTTFRLLFPIVEEALPLTDKKIEKDKWAKRSGEQKHGVSEHLFIC